MIADKELLFGVLAVQLKFATPHEVMEAAGAWATDQSRGLAARLRESGVLSEERIRMLTTLVDEAIRAHDGDGGKALAILGGDRAVRQTFMGTINHKKAGGAELVKPEDIDGRDVDEDVFAVTDSLGICSFATTSSYIISVPSLCRLIKAALGVDLSEEELRTIGRRTVVLERMFNFRENPSRKDILPWRLMNEPIIEGPCEGQMNSEAELKDMLNKYYRLQGYDPDTGRPTRDVLSSLGLLQEVKGIEALLEGDT